MIGSWKSNWTPRICIIFLIGQQSNSGFVHGEETTTEVVTTSKEVVDVTNNDEFKVILDLSTLPLPPMYNKYELPTNSYLYKDGHVETSNFNVFVALFIRSILDVDTKEEVLTLDTDVGFRWNDAKIVKFLFDLNFTDPISGLKFRDQSLDADFLDKIWKPDVFIDEMASSENTSLLGKLITLKFYADRMFDPDNNQWANSAGDFVFFSRKTLKLRCGMNFHFYPADTQTCTYTLRSYSYQPVNLLWYHENRHANEITLKKIPAIYLNDPSDANFDISLDSIEPLYELGKQHKENYFIRETFNFHRRGNYSALRFTIKVRRKLSYHVVQTYVPSVLLVLITWLCFILPSSMIEARIGISMTTLLTLTAMFASVREQSPDVSYTMAIDIWMVFCIFEVFLALLLFTTIYWLRRRAENSILRNKDTIDSVDEDPIETLQQTKEAYNGLMKFSKRYAFWAFALSFVAFFFGYWTYLLLGSGYMEWKINPLFNALDEEQGGRSSKPYECYRRRYYYEEQKWIEDECP